MRKRSAVVLLAAALVPFQLVGATNPALAAALSFTINPTSGPRGTKIDFVGAGCPHDPSRPSDGTLGLPDGDRVNFTSDAAGNFAGQYDTTQNGAGAYLPDVVCFATGEIAFGSVYTVTNGTAMQAEVSGSTWYTDGRNSHSGAPGTEIRAYATGAFTNLAYRMVLGIGDAAHACVTAVQVLNPTARYANRNGYISTTVGTVQPGLAPGTYKLCFEDASSGNLTGTGGATFTVLAP